MKTLTLAKDLKLPADEAVAQKYAFIGRSGSGKTYGAMKLAELFLEAEAQVIALDWVGNWWSLRLAKDGKSPGFAHVYIFGGEHADAPLEATGGAMMADLLVDKHISAVLDLSPFRKGERTRFATAFAEQLFHRKKTARTACHLFLEEAQAFLPQMVRGDDARMVGVFEDIGKVGRNYGIGVSILSQRPQAVNKDVLNQTEVLLAFQTNGPQERKTIGGWVVEHGDANAALIDELPTLAKGDAYVWSPQWLQICRRIHIAERVTYDASSTPTQHAKQVKPKALTPADLAELGEAMKATIGTAKANDPRELKRLLAQASKDAAVKDKRISELETRGSRTAGSSPFNEKPRPDKPLFTDADRAVLAKVVERLQFPELTRNVVLNVNDAIDALTRTLRDVGEDIVAQQSKARDAFLKVLDSKGMQKILAKLEGVALAAPGPGTHQTKSALVTSPARVAPPPSRPVARADASSNGHVPSGKFRSMLVALAQAGRTLSDGQVAARAGMALSGTFDKYLSQQRSSGWVVGGRDALRITEEGLTALGAYEPLPTGHGLRDYWLSYVSAGKQRDMLAALFEAHPHPLSDEKLAERAQMALSGTFDKYLSQLRTLLLIEGKRDSLKASDELFD